MCHPLPMETGLPLLPRGAAAIWGLSAAFCKAEAKSKHLHLLFGSEHTHMGWVGGETTGSPYPADQMLSWTNSKPSSQLPLLIRPPFIYLGASGVIDENTSITPLRIFYISFCLRDLSALFVLLKLGTSVRNPTARMEIS